MVHKSKRCGGLRFTHHFSQCPGTNTAKTLPCQIVRSKHFVSRAARQYFEPISDHLDNVRRRRGAQPSSCISLLRPSRLGGRHGRRAQ